MRGHCPVTGTAAGRHAAYSLTHSKDSLTRWRLTHECKKKRNMLLDYGIHGAAAVVCAVKLNVFQDVEQTGCAWPPPQERIGAPTDPFMAL